MLHGNVVGSRADSANAYEPGELREARTVGTTSKKLRDGVPDDPATKADESFAGVTQLAAAYRHDNELADGTDVPVEAVTRSASGHRSGCHAGGMRGCKPGGSRGRAVSRSSVSCR